MFYILIPVTGFTCHLKSNLTKYSEFTDLHFHVTLYSNYWLVCLLSGSCAQLCPNRFPFQISNKQNLSCSCLVFLLRRGPSIVKCLRKGLWTVQRLSQWHCSSLRCFCEAFSLYHFFAKYIIHGLQCLMQLFDPFTKIKHPSLNHDNHC